MSDSVHKCQCRMWVPDLPDSKSTAGPKGWPWMLLDWKSLWARVEWESLAGASGKPLCCSECRDTFHVSITGVLVPLTSGLAVSPNWVLNKSFNLFFPSFSEGVPNSVLSNGPFPCTGERGWSSCPFLNHHHFSVVAYSCPGSSFNPSEPWSSNWKAGTVWWFSNYFTMTYSKKYIFSYNPIHM